MFPPTTTRHASPAGQVTTRHLEGSIIETVYTGYACTELVRSVLEITPEVLRAVKGARWLLDLSEASGSDSSARIPGQEILRLFREMGGTEFAVVLKSSTLRMIFSAVSFAAGLPVKLFDNAGDALRFLRAGAPPPESVREPAPRKSLIDLVPACPQCAAPMEWRSAHERHYCGACSVYE